MSRMAGVQTEMIEGESEVRNVLRTRERDDDDNKENEDDKNKWERRRANRSRSSRKPGQEKQGPSTKAHLRIAPPWH